MCICMCVLPYVCVYVHDPVRLRLRYLFQVKTDLLFKVATVNFVCKLMSVSMVAT